MELKVSGCPTNANSENRRARLSWRAPDAAQRTRVRAPRGPSTGSAMRCRSGAYRFSWVPALRCTAEEALHRVRDTKESSRRGEVDCGFRERRQTHVGLLLLLQGLIQQPGGVFHAELGGPLFQRAITGNFVVLDGLRGGKHAGVKRLAALVLVHDLLALVEDALDRVAGLAARRLVEQFENLLEALDLAFGLAVVLFERRTQLVGLSGLRHFRQHLQNLLFGVVNVLQGIEEEIVEVFVFFFCGHGALLHW